MLNNAGIYRQHILRKLFLKIGLRLAPDGITISLEKKLVIIHPSKTGLQQISLKLSFQRAPVFFLKSRSCHGIRVYKATQRLRRLCRIDIHSSKKLKIFYSDIPIFDQTW